MVLMNFVHLNRVINELQICIIELSLIFFFTSMASGTEVPYRRF